MGSSYLTDLSAIEGEFCVNSVVYIDMLLLDQKNYFSKNIALYYQIQTDC